ALLRLPEGAAAGERRRGLLPAHLAVEVRRAVRSARRPPRRRAIPPRRHRRSGGGVGPRPCSQSWRAHARARATGGLTGIGSLLYLYLVSAQVDERSSFHRHE